MASRPIPIRPGRFLPRDPSLDAPYRLTPQLVFRIGILGFLTLAAFAVLFFRLWALQVLSGNQYLVAAQNNQLRVIRTDAPRGPVEDRYGRVLVDNTSATAVKVWPADLPKHGAYAELRRLARILEVPLADITKRDQEEPRRPGDAGHRPRRRQRERGPLPARAPVGVPGHDDHEHVRPELPVRRSRCAHPRLRRRDLAGPAEVEQGLRARRQGRPGRDRVLVRQGAARAAGPGAAPRRLARAADQPDRAADAGHTRLRGPAHARREAPARRAAGDRQRDQPRAGKPPVVREGGRDRRPRPAGRRDSRTRLVPDLRPEALHQPQERRPRTTPRSERGQGGRLSGPRPRDRGRISAGLDVQAGDSAGRDAGAHPLAVQRAAVHGLVQGRWPDHSRTGTRS